MMGKDSFPPPKIETVMQFLRWEMHQAAYILADSWPDNLYMGGIACDPDLIGMGSLLLPYDFNLKSLGEGFGKVYGCLKKDLENGVLFGISTKIFHSDKPYGSCTSFLIRPGDALRWALNEGLLLPSGLCEYMDVSQIKCKRPSKILHDHVKIQIIGQYVLSENPRFNIAEISSHGKWIEKFGPKGRISSRTISRVLGILFDSVGEPGRQPDISIRGQTRAYTAKPLPEVMQIDFRGKVSYCFPLLKTVVITSFEIQKERDREIFLESTPLEFINHFLKDRVMRMYLEGCQTCVLNLIVKFCTENLTQHFHHKMFSLTPEQYRESKLKHLLEMNKEFILEHLTCEERALIEKSIKPSTT